MSGPTAFNILAGVVTIASFVFGVWIWMCSEFRRAEFLRVMRIIDNIARTAIWEVNRTAPRSSESQNRQTEKMAAYLASIKKASSQYVSDSLPPGAVADPGQLIERGILWTKAMMDDLELSSEAREIWLVTPDLHPDVGDKDTGHMVHANLRKGKRYIYFYPEDLPHADAEIKRLLSNVGATDARTLRERVSFVALDKREHSRLFPRHNNIVFYFLDQKRVLLPRCFEEVVLTKVAERGAFWQEHGEEAAKSLRALLESSLPGAC